MTDKIRPKAVNAGIGMHRVTKFKDVPVILLDPGHGGMIKGKYQTKGKRSPVWEDGRQLFEGEFNRAVVNRVKQLMYKAGYPCVDIVNTQEDMPLEQRTRKANKFYHDNTKDCILISVHANAGGGTGHETFTSPGETSADPFAELMIEALCNEFDGELRLRADDSDGDHDKEARFWMVMQTVMPAFLVECAFMDTLSPDCELLMSEEGRDRFAKAIFDGIERIYKSLEDDEQADG